ncbi:MAG: hypothetical protein GX638_12845 [Crenarchaeota archaeon]|nr:hypothetical protein [Thermoproteota archaeon]
MLIFHIITIVDLKDYTDHKELGICSPKALYDLDRNLFMKTSYENYLERTATFKNKSKVTAEDVLDFLDNAPIRKNKGFNSSTIFLTFLPYSYFPRILQKKLIPCVQLSINSKYLKKHIPKLVMYGGVKNITWDEIEDPKFIDWVESSTENPTNNTRIYSRVPHLALINAYQIPKKHIDDVLIIKRREQSTATHSNAQLVFENKDGLD